ncbi:unnamed protein product [Enterobius vermicularis]|uniref:CULLIN_2 domain-containing protein n=1 Tax=Enterobius vermicularis TaxID=51028 RepID=A0A0N4UVX8_ENTVE|nr:unnamed protein product [Enterobius vermicularis]
MCGIFLGPKYVLFDCFESLPTGFFDSLISFIADDNEISRVIFVVRLSMNESNIYSKCSEESLSQIATTCLEFPSAKTVLDALLHTLLVDKSLFELLRDVFLNGSYSLTEVRKLLKLAVLRFVAVHSDKEVLISPYQVDVYSSLLDLLFRINKDFLDENPSKNELHLMLQGDYFFNKENSVLQLWKSYWSSLDADKMISYVRELQGILEKVDCPFLPTVRAFEEDLLNLDDRESEMRKSLNMSSGTPVKDGPKESRKGLQAYYEDQAKLRVFSQYLIPYHQLPTAKSRLLVGSATIKDLCFPNFRANVEHDVSRTVDLELANEQLDISYVYRAIQVLLKSKKKITVDELLPLLETQLSSFPEIDISTRIFRCLGELEFLGIISAVRRRGNTALQSYSMESNETEKVDSSGTGSVLDSQVGDHSTAKKAVEEIDEQVALDGACFC